MCHPAKCRSCSKTTWSGCGSHVDQVMRNVAKDDRCSCDRNAAKAPREPGRFARLFAR